VGLKTNRNT